jgi:DNA-binding response OmpR family regulator
MSSERCRVLFVEDECAVSMLLEDMLLDMGVEVVGPVATVEGALKLARTAEVDAAVLDINVGGLAVYPVAEVLTDRSIPILFVTGYDQAALPERFRSIPLLGKPFSTSAFETALRAVLRDSPCEPSAPEFSSLA